MKTPAFNSLIVVSLALASASLAQPGPPEGRAHDDSVLDGMTLLEPRVQHGQPCERHQFSWLAGIVIDGSGMCSGALISSTTVLTAAHCVVGRTTFDVSLGDVDLNNPNDQDIVIRSIRAVPHEHFDRSTLANDVAVILLPQAIANSSLISYARLPTRSMAQDTFEDGVGIIAGFGGTEDSGAGRCHWAGNRTIVDNAECKRLNGDKIRDSNICINTSDGTSTCRGDSGSAFMLQAEDGGHYHIGIASWAAPQGRMDCQSGNPRVSTRTTSFLSWIEANGEGIEILP